MYANYKYIEEGTKIPIRVLCTFYTQLEGILHGIFSLPVLNYNLSYEITCDIFPLWYHGSSLRASDGGCITVV